MSLTLSLLSTLSKTCSVNSSVFMHYFQVLLLGTVLSYNRCLSAYCGRVVRIYSALPQSVQLTDCTAVCRWVTCSIILPSRWKLQHWKLSFLVLLFKDVSGNTTWLMFLPLAPIKTSSAGLLILAFITVMLSTTCLLLLSHLLGFHLYLCKRILETSIS